ncbi:hypothetical protein PENSPDRAFT_682396 [Peniophora sp. CONT]|nr:hypothetical protein PENSPDRAFT_682396 [Peniophora sp. CONT]
MAELSTPLYEASPCHLFGSGLLSDSVTFLSFSPDGLYLVVGCADLQVFVLQVETWAIIRVFTLHKGPPTAVVWARLRMSTCLFVGDFTGDLHEIMMGHSVANDKQHVYNIGGPIYALAQQGQVLAVSAGHVVSVRTLESYATNKLVYNGTKVFQEPSAFVVNGDSTSPLKPIAISLSFLASSNILLGAYETHGIVIWNERGQSLKHILPRAVCIGGACVSPSGDRLYVTNLADGIDVYRLHLEQPQRSAFETTFKTSIGTNLPVPVTCIHGGLQLLIGGTQGQIEVLSSADGFAGGWTRTSPSYAPRVQTVAYTCVDGSQRLHYIAFGAYEKGKQASVAIYRGIEEKMRAPAIWRPSSTSLSEAGWHWRLLYSMGHYALTAASLVALVAMAWLSMQLFELFRDLLRFLVASAGAVFYILWRSPEFPPPVATINPA